MTRREALGPHTSLTEGAFSTWVLLDTADSSVSSSPPVMLLVSGEEVALCGTSAPFAPGAQSIPHPFLEVTLLAVPVCDVFYPRGISWLTF